MNDYQATRSNVGLPFERARNDYRRLSDWCVVISAGTLLWFMGNTERLTVSYIHGERHVHNIWIYITFMSLFFLSTMVFAFLRGYMYVHDYEDSRLRDIMDIEERIIRPDENKPPISSSEKDYYASLYNEYRKGYDNEHLDKTKWGKTKWISTLREENISRTIKDFGGKSLHIWKARINLCLILGTACYLLGLILSTYYVFTFLLRF